MDIKENDPKSFDVQTAGSSSIYFAISQVTDRTSREGLSLLRMTQSISEAIETEIIFTLIFNKTIT